MKVKKAVLKEPFNDRRVSRHKLLAIDVENSELVRNSQGDFSLEYKNQNLTMKHDTRTFVIPAGNIIFLELVE